MPNPANELAEYLDSWASIKKGESHRTVRASTDADRFFREQIRACALLGEIQRDIERMEADDGVESPYRVLIRRWWAAIVQPDEPWASPSSTNRRVIEPEMIAALRGLGRYIDKNEVRSFLPTRASVQVARDALDELNDLFTSGILNLADEMRAYLVRLVNEIRRVLEEENARLPFDAVRRIHELRGFVESLAVSLEGAGADESLPNKLKRLGQGIVPIAVPVIDMTGAVLSVAGGVLSITAG